MAQQDKEIEQVLENIGFTSNEIKVYLTLVKEGSSKAGKVAKLAKIDRSSCYNSLKSLLEKGIISYVLIGNVRWFQATGPRRLLEYIKEQEEGIKDILPKLQDLHRHKKQEGQVRLYKGMKGVKTVFQDILRTGADNYVFGSEGQFEDNLPAYSELFNRLADEKGMIIRMIKRPGRKEKKSPNNRYVDKDIKSPVVTNIYGNKIALIVWTDEPEAIVIENRSAAEAYRNYFEFMWKHAKE